MHSTMRASLSWVALLVVVNAPLAADALRLHGMRTQHRGARTAAVRCAETSDDGDDLSPPRDLDSVCEEARLSLRASLLAGQRCLTVDASMAALDVTSRGYDP